MDQWRVTVLGDGGVGKTALAVQVSRFSCCTPPHAADCPVTLLHALIVPSSSPSIALLVSLSHIPPRPLFFYGITATRAHTYLLLLLSIEVSHCPRALFYLLTALKDL